MAHTIFCFAYVVVVVVGASYYCYFMRLTLREAHSDNAWIFAQLRHRVMLVPRMIVIESEVINLLSPSMHFPSCPNDLRNDTGGWKYFTRKNKSFCSFYNLKTNFIVCFIKNKQFKVFVWMHHIHVKRHYIHVNLHHFHVNLHHEKLSRWAHIRASNWEEIIDGSCVCRSCCCCTAGVWRLFVI